MGGSRRNLTLRLRTLARLNLMVASSLDVGTVLGEIVRSAAELMEARLVGLWTADEGASTLELAALSDDGLLESIPSRTVPFGQGALGRAALSRQRLVLSDAEVSGEATEQFPHWGWFVEQGITDALVVPILSRDRLLGVLGLGRSTPFVLDRDTEELLDGFVAQSVIAIEHARLFTRTVTLSRRLVEAQEQERQTIAHELHDQVGQDLTAVKLLLQRAARTGGDARSVPLGDAVALVDELIEGVRDLSLDLRPAMLDDLGLLPALEWFLGRYRTRTGISVTFEPAGPTPKPSPPVATAAFRIVQEALTNVARHARATEATVRVRVDGDTIVLEVEDRGSGFEAARVETGQTAGLSGMRDRARWLGGHLTIDSTPGQGTRVRATLPLRTPDGEA